VSTGKKFWVYNGDNFIEGSPRPLTDYGLPPHADKVDAVMVWNKNSKTFLFRSVLVEVNAFIYYVTVISHTVILKTQ
jgi:hypothetical protein